MVIDPAVIKGYEARAGRERSPPFETVPEFVYGEWMKELLYKIEVPSKSLG
jgi:hypothetical protein